MKKKRTIAGVTQTWQYVSIDLLGAMMDGKSDYMQKVPIEYSNNP